MTVSSFLRVPAVPSRIRREPVPIGSSIELRLPSLSEAMAKADPRTKLLYFDASGMSAQIAVPEEAARLATRMRQIGLERILFGSDGATGGNAPPREAWTAFRNLPLTEAEFRAIALNVPPYLRK